MRFADLLEPQTSLLGFHLRAHVLNLVELAADWGWSPECVWCHARRDRPCGREVRAFELGGGLEHLGMVRYPVHGILRQDPGRHLAGRDLRAVSAGYLRRNLRSQVSVDSKSFSEVTQPHVVASSSAGLTKRPTPPVFLPDPMPVRKPASMPVRAGTQDISLRSG